MTARRLVFTVLSAVALALPSTVLAQSSMRVVVDGLTRDVPVLERQGRRFVALEEIAHLLGGRIIESTAERAVLDVGGRRMEIHRRMPFVGVDGRLYQMTQTAQKDSDGYFLPASAVTELLPRIWPARFGVQAGSAPVEDPPPADAGAPSVGEVPPPDIPAGPPEGAVESGMISAAGGEVHLEYVDLWVEPDRTRIGFVLSKTPDVMVDSALPGTIQLRLAGTRIPATVRQGLVGIGLIDSVGIADAADGTVLTLWVDRAAGMYAVSPLRAPHGVEVVLLSTPGEPMPRLASGRRRAPVQSGPGPSPVRGIALPGGAGLWTVVIDAGHGGRDPGAVGPGGRREKDLTLMMARGLKRRLDRIEGMRVVLTREDDRFVPLAERTRRANDEHADLFVSIHLNASRDRDAEGFETYFLSASRSEDARRVARMENEALRYENPEIDPESLGELNFILWDLAQNEYLRESSALADLVQGGLDRRSPLKSRGVKQAGFFVLNGAFMPAVLVETAFISNPREAKQLDDPAFRDRLIDGLAEGLTSYLESRRRKVAAPTTAR